MKFTVKQLFNVTDGRLSTSMDDVYEILNTFTGVDLMTHQLPTAMTYLEKVKPNWFVKAKNQLAKIKEKAGTDDYDTLMDYIDKFHSKSYHDVTKPTNIEKNEMTIFLAKNDSFFGK